MAGAKARAAVRVFQTKAEFVADGITGPKRQAALARALAQAGKSTVLRPNAPPPWHEELLRRKDLHEVRQRSKLMALLRSDGKLSSCGGAIQTCLALTLRGEPQPVNPYLARNWLKLSVKLETPALGCILVFGRGSKIRTSGHVGLYAGEGAQGYLHVLGGNQSGAITIARFDKARLLGMRWPATFPKPTTDRVLLSVFGAPISTSEASRSDHLHHFFWKDLQPP